MRAVIVFLLCMPIAAMAGDDCNKIDSCGYSSMWSNFSRFTVTYSNSKDEKGSTFDYIVKDRESLITFDTQTGKANILSIPGAAILWRGIGKTGIKTTEACYEDVRDTYAIMESYAVRALFFVGFGVKGGPEMIPDSVRIDVANKKDTRVQINPGDHMMIHGPWSLKGNVKKNDKITFEISHEFMAKGKPASLFLVGAWQNNSVVMPIENTQSLSEWLVCLSGEYSYENGKSKFTPVVEDMSKLTTIGDLKALTLRSSGTPQKRGAP